MEAEHFTLIKSQNYPNRFYAELGLKGGSVIFLFIENNCDCIIPYCTEMKYVASGGNDYFLCLGEKNRYTKEKLEWYALYDAGGKKLFSGEKVFMREKVLVLEKALAELATETNKTHLS